MNKIASKTIWHKKQRFLWAKGLAICFCAILLMSHNTFAVTLTEEVSFQSSYNLPYTYLTFSDGTYRSWANTNFTNDDVRNLSSVSFRNSSNGSLSELTSGRYLSVVARFGFPGASDQWNSTGALTVSNVDVSCPVIDITLQDSQMHQVNNATLTWQTMIVTCKYTGSGTPAMNLTVRTSNYNQNWQFLATNASVWSRQDFASSDDISAVTSAVNTLRNAINNKLDTTNSTLNDIKISLNDLIDSQEEVNQKELNSTTNIENQDPADIGSSDNAGTTNLVGALSGFITTIANTPASNCLINGDLGNLDIGGVNLCQGKEHFNTLIEFIGFTALFGVVFWAGYHLVKRTLSLIDWARSK